MILGFVSRLQPECNTQRRRWSVPGNFGVDEDEPVDARAIDQRQAPRDGATGVLRDRAVALHAGAVHQDLQPARVGLPGEIGRAGPFGIAHAGQVYDVAGVMLREGRKHAAPGVSVQRKAVHQQQS